MINIDIRPNTDLFYVHTASAPCSVSRIGDVLLLEKNSDINLQQYRKPWKEIFKLKNIEAIGGTLLGKNCDILRMEAEDFDLHNINSDFNNKEISLSVLQKGVHLSLCFLKGEFCGYKFDSKKAIFDFNVLKSEMIYNR